MSLSFEPKAFDWVAGLTQWAIVTGVIVLILLIAALLMSILTSGLNGVVQVVSYIQEAFTDLFGTSLRRTWALTMLTFREAFRRKTLLVFVVFALLFLFAGWFMSDVTVDAELQVKNYVSFVLRTISWLILPVVMLLACWGLPEDIRARSLHTVVTKPVRRHEVVLGRIFGFSLIGWFVLGVMGVFGYFWVVRQLAPEMRTQLVARVPIYGEATFLDREGNDKDAKGELLKAGINVGDEVPFRTFVEGSTKARAIWDFQGVHPANLIDGNKLVLESSFQSFRTHKGNMERGLICQYTLVNLAKNLRVPLKVFEVQEFRRNSYDVMDRNKAGLTDEAGKPVEIAELLQDGKLRVEVACLSGGQFLGMARPDLFVRLPDRPFLASYAKSIVSIGLMTFMVVVLGVTSGCFVKGPVATMLTCFIVVVGRIAHEFLEEVVTGHYKDNPQFEMKGRGIMDSLIRIPTHKAPTVELDDSMLTRVANGIDNVELSLLWAVQHLFPDFSKFDTTAYAANSFDVPWKESLLPSLAVTLGFCLPWMAVGYFSLKARELEAK